MVVRSFYFGIPQESGLKPPMTIECQPNEREQGRDSTAIQSITINSQPQISGVYVTLHTIKNCEASEDKQPNLCGHDGHIEFKA